MTECSTMIEIAQCLINCLNITAFRCDKSKREIATCQAFGRYNNVWQNVPMLKAPPFACTPQANKNLVSNQQNPVAVTDFAHGRPIVVWRDTRAQPSAAY